MDEYHRLTVCTGSCLTITQHSNIVRLELLNRGIQIIDFQAIVVNATGGVILQVFSDRRVIA